MESPMNLKFYSDGKKEVINYGISQFEMNPGDMTKKFASIPEYEINSIRKHMQSLMSSLRRAYRVSVQNPSNYGIDQSKEILVNAYKSIKGSIASLPEDDMHVLFFFPMVKAIMELHNLYGCRFEAERVPKWHQIESPTLKDSIRALLLDFLHLFIPKWRLSNEEKIFRNLEFLYSNYLFDYGRVPSSKSQSAIWIDLESFYFKTIPPLQINSWLDTFEYCVDMLIKNCDEVLQVRSSALRFIDEHILPSEEILNRSEIDRKQAENILSLTQIHYAELCMFNREKHFISRCKLCGCFFISKSKSCEYCSVPNSQYGNKTCSEILEKSKKLPADPIEKRRVNKSKAYRKWINDNDMKYALSTTSEGREILNEMNKIYTDWHNNAQSVLFKYNSGEIDENTAINSIELPPLYDRSPLFDEYKDKHKL